MAESEKGTVTIQELLISTLAQSDTLPKLLIEKGLITKEEYLEKIRKRTSDVSAV
jgi:Fe-S cluster assembly scaffold protein SufB